MPSDTLPDAAPPPLTPEDARSAPTWRAAYSDRTAVLMAKLAQYAYLPLGGADGAEDQAADQPGVGRLAQLLAGGDFTLKAVFDRDDSQAFLAVNEQEFAVLAFRGTANWGDWKVDLDAPLIAVPHGDRSVRVHEGFWKAFQATRTDMQAAIDAHVPDDLGLYITGHSLGGALAQIAAMVFERDNLAACYTFGSPRVATLQFDHDVKCPHYRVVDNWDLVPGVPPPLYQGYLHAGDPRLLRGAAPKEALRRDRDIIPRLLADLWSLALWPITRQISSINDHMIWNYRRRLESVRDQRKAV